MSALLKLLELSPGAAADIWIGPGSGPAGKRAYGGQFVAQSLAAACHDFLQEQARPEGLIVRVRADEEQPVEPDW